MGLHVIEGFCVYIHAPSGAQRLTFVEGLGTPDTTEWAPSKQGITVVCKEQYSTVGSKIVI